MSSPLTYRPEVDGLRAIAVLPVILFHAGIAGFAGGYVGVDVFFVISGYLITSILLGELSAGRFSLRTFYERRARRILPALTVILLVSAVAGWRWMTPAEFKAFCASAMSVLWFSSNVLFWRESGYFDQMTEYKPLLHTWSLAVEEQYYLLFPLLMWALWRFGRRRLVFVLVAIALLSFGICEYCAVHYPAPNFYLAPPRAWELMIGSLLAIASFSRGPDLGLRRPVRQWGAAAGLTLLVGAIVLMDNHTPFPSHYTLLPVIGTALLIACGTPDTTVGRALSMRPVVQVGLISYSAYLWHQPLLAFGRILAETPPTVAVRLGLCALTLALAWLTWRYVEAPFRDRRRFSARWIFTATAVLIVAGTSAAALGFWQDGFVARFPQLPSGWTPGRWDCAVPTRGLDQQICQPTIQTFASTAGPRRILFVGDSLLMSMTDSIRDASARTGVPVHISARTACPILVDTTFVGDDNRPDLPCIAFNRAWPEFVRRHRITDVVIISAFNRYFDRGNAGLMSELLGSDPPRLRASLSRAFAHTVKTLADSGARVTFVGQVPDFAMRADRGIHRLLVQQVRAGMTPRIEMSRTQHEADCAAFREAVRQAGGAILDTSPLWCTAQSCSPIIDGRCFYADSFHLAAEGDRHMVPFWQAFLKTTFVPAPAP